MLKCQGCGFTVQCPGATPDKSTASTPITSACPSCPCAIMSSLWGSQPCVYICTLSPFKWWTELAIPQVFPWSRSEHAATHMDVGTVPCCSGDGRTLGWYCHWPCCSVKSQLKCIAENRSEHGNLMWKSQGPSPPQPHFGCTEAPWCDCSLA